MSERRERRRHTVKRTVVDHQGLRRASAPRFRIFYDILTHALVNVLGEDQRHAIETLAKRCHAVSLRYQQLEYYFSHILLDCPQITCPFTTNRSTNARSALSILPSLEKSLDQLADSLDVFPTDRLDEIVEKGQALPEVRRLADVALRMNEEAVERYNQKGGTSVQDPLTALFSLPEFHRLAGVPPEMSALTIYDNRARIAVRTACELAYSILDDYTAGYPFDLAKPIGTIAAGLDGESVSYFAQQLVNAIRNENPRFGLVHTLYSQARLMMPLLDSVRKGCFTLPPLQEIERIGAYARALSRGRATSKSIQFLDEVARIGFNPKKIADCVAESKLGWQAANRLVKILAPQEELLLVGDFFDRHGRDVDLLAVFLEAGVPANRAMEAVACTARWTFRDNRRLAEVLRDRRCKPPLIRYVSEHVEMLTLGDASVLEFILEHPKREQLLEAYVQYGDRSEVGKQHALVGFAREKLTRPFDDFVRELDQYEDSRVASAVRRSSSVTEALAALHDEQAIRDPYESVRSRDGFRLLVQFGLSDRAPSEDLPRIVTFVEQLYNTGIRECVLRNVDLFDELVRDEEKRRLVLDHQDTMVTRPYATLMRLLYGEPTPARTEPLQVNRLVFIGERLADDVIERVAAELGVPCRRVEQTATLRQLKQIISPGDAVVYYVSEAGHCHTGPVRHMTGVAGGRFIDIKVTGEDRIKEELRKRLAG